ncbi:MAG: hypothetical protein ACOC4F_02040 [bacterium]
MKTLRICMSVLTLLAFTATPLLAIDDLLERIDEASTDERYDDERSLLDEAEASASTARERAEVYWRMARMTLVLVDRDRARGDTSDDELVARLEDGEALAAEAIEADPSLAEGHFWMAANMGRRGQVRGVLNSLFMAGDVRDYAQAAISRDEDLAEAYHLLGILYRELPGGIISFGDAGRAVSLGRRAVDLNREAFENDEADEIYYQYQIELAQSLWARDWNARRRGRAHRELQSEYRSASTALDRAFTYEGARDLPSGSDRDEAVAMIEDVISSLESLRSPTQAQRDYLAEAQELLDDWN